MNVGPYQLVWWSPVEVEWPDSTVDSADATLVTLRVRRPHLWGKRGALYGIYRWRVVLGWLDVRRFASDEEIAAAATRSGGES